MSENNPHGRNWKKPLSSNGYKIGDNDDDIANGIDDDNDDDIANEGREDDDS